jgi:hypothetical protein
MAFCDDCKATMDPHALGVAHEVVGWVEARAGQGLKANAVHDKTFTGRVRCPECTKLRRMGATVGQGELFE